MAYKSEEVETEVRAKVTNQLREKRVRIGFATRNSLISTLQTDLVSSQPRSTLQVLALFL